MIMIDMYGCEVLNTGIEKYKRLHRCGNITVLKTKSQKNTSFAITLLRWTEHMYWLYYLFRWYAVFL
jgi:hypothetical protein